MNYAVYATHTADENRREATRIELDASGNVVNPVNPWGNPWAQGAIWDAQDRRAFQVYGDVMDQLEILIPTDDDAKIVRAFNKATEKLKDVAHAESMLESLQVAALNGSKSALIAYAAASIFINRLAFVSLSWYVSAAEMADHEGFAVTIRVASSPGTAPVAQPAIVAPAVAQPAAIIPQPAAPIVRIDVASSPAPRVLVTPLIIRDATGRVLTATADGWLAESESKPGNYHTVSADGSTCSCWGSRRWGHCWHRTAVMAHNKRERGTARPNKSRKPRKQSTIRPRKQRTTRHTYHPPRPTRSNRMWK